MRRFRFALRPVAVLRTHRELQARERFIAAVQRWRRAGQELAETHRRVSALAAALLASRHDRYQPGAAGFSAADYGRESAAELAAERALFTAAQEMQARRNEYVDEHRRLKVIQRLEEKARAAHQAAGQREEQAAFDDLSCARFRPNARPGDRRQPPASS